MRPAVIVVGAGMGGLAAAIDLARRGAAVTVLERAAAPGGKMRRVMVEEAGVDGGPTVFTMRWVFESLLRDAGTRLEDELQLSAADILARHAWRAGGRLDLHADIERSAEAIAEFAGPDEADGYRRFCARSRQIYLTLERPFIDGQRPSPFELTRRVGWSRLDRLLALRPWQSMWPALGEFFHDPRLRQLFGRYATYCGSSPLSAPATLMLVAHVEQDGVWLVRGGMHEVARVLERVAVGRGAGIRYGAHVCEITTRNGQASGVVLDSGEQLTADAVIFCGDCGALAAGHLGESVRGAVPVVKPAARSLSAITWCLHARTQGFPLVHHNVFFAEDYAREFQAIFHRRTITEAPTVYVCAQDRDADEQFDGPERLLILVNAPADGDHSPLSPSQIQDVQARTFELLRQCGLVIDGMERGVVIDPRGFDALFPATGGALYGRATHGSFATFARPGSRSRVRGLYLAGGSVHPGPGVPMATLSGRRAADSVAQDFGLQA